MSLQDEQNFLAQIYTDEDLRRTFLSEPEKVGKEKGLINSAISELSQILPDEINSFSESLFYKRLREVEKLLPLSREALGERFEFYFREFANQFTSQSVKKHLDDAVEFCRFLQQKNLELPWAKDAARFEQAKLEFWNFDKPLILNFFNYDLKTKQKRKNFICWLKIGEKRIMF